MPFSTRSDFDGTLFALAMGWEVDYYSFIRVFLGFGLMPLISLAIVWFVLGPLRPWRELDEIGGTL